MRLSIDRAPRLVLRFALPSALILALTAGGLLWFVHQRVVARAEVNVRSHAQFVARTILAGDLTASDFARPVDVARRRELDRLFARQVLVGGSIRAKLYRRDGVVTYSNHHALIGTRSRDDGPRRAAHGRSAADVSNLNAEGSGGPSKKVLETYVPVRLHGRIAGVFELYDDYGPVSASAWKEFLPIAGGFAAALIALWVLLIPILRSASRSLSNQVDRMRHQALHDGLTELPNRSFFHARVRQAIAEASGKTRAGFAVLLIDLDRFKEINDTLGHQQGDLVLREVARRLRTSIRESDTVARLGGDEFSVLALDIRDEETAAIVGEKLRGALAAALEQSGLLLDIDASIGIALYPQHGDDAYSLLRRADVAMYLAKELHTSVEVYSQERDDYSPERLALAGELRRGIDKREIVVYYQPQAEPGNGRIGKVEALVRWQHPSRGLLGPGEFVPIVEHTGLIRLLTHYVLETSLAQCAAWRAAGREIGVAVNIAGRDLLDLRFPDQVGELLQRWQVPPHMLELEITENTILTDPHRAKIVLDRLAALGIRLAIDDFGCGNSSLGYLKRLPVNVLKIDRSFVMNMEESEDDAVIVRSTIELGHNLGLEVVAEGVETEPTRMRLAALGCDTIQGYLIGKPSPPEDVGLDEDVAAAV